MGDEDVQAVGLAHAMEGGMARDSVDTVHGIQVLAERELEDRERSLTI